MKSKLLISRAMRNLRHLANFREVSTNPPDFSDWAMQFPFDYGETLIGAYENTAGEREGGILVTTRGLHVWSGRTMTFISYYQIEQVALPDEPAEASSGRIILQMSDQPNQVILIKGGRGKLKDTPGFAHFLEQIIQDVKQ